MVLVRYVISILREAALLVGCIVKVTGRWVGARNAQASNIAKRRRDACIYIQFYQFKCVYSTHNLYIITCHPFLRGKSVLICQNYYKQSKKIYAEHYLFCPEFASSGIASNLQAALFSWEITRGLTKTSSTDFMFGLLAGSLLVQRIPSLNTLLISSR